MQGFRINSETLTQLFQVTPGNYPSWTLIYTAKMEQMMCQCVCLSVFVCTSPAVVCELMEILQEPPPWQ